MTNIRQTPMSFNMQTSQIGRNQHYHSYWPLVSFLPHLVLQKHQFPMHRVQPTLACLIRFVPPIVSSFENDVPDCCMDFVPKTSKQAPFHMSGVHQYQQLASPNSSSTRVPFHSLADS